MKEPYGIINFAPTAYHVFQRLITGEGNGLFILWGGVPGEKHKAGKSAFLDMVDELQKGPAPALPFITEKFLFDLVVQMKPNEYQCVWVDRDFPFPPSKLLSMPLSVVVPLAIANAANRRGLNPGRGIVILCDNIEDLIRYDGNKNYLGELAKSLDKQQTITFLGASRKTWNAEQYLSGHLLPLG